MTRPEIEIQKRMSEGTEATKKWVVLLCAGVVCATGCATRRTPVKPVIGVIGFAHPVIPVATAVELEDPPDLTGEIPEAPTELAIAPSAPARPHVAPPPEREPAPEERAPEPVIAPELSTQEANAARAETQHNLDLMEKNLTLAWGRKLNAGQQDLISKVRGFAENAREAMRSGDWVRAKNLSKKAEVLSEELAASL